MAEWTPEATEYLEGYLKQVRALARGTGEDGDDVAAGLREHIVEKTEREAGPLITLEVLRRVLAVVGTPETIVADGATRKMPPASSVGVGTHPSDAAPSSGPPPAPQPAAPDRSGRFLRWTGGCLVLWVVILIALAILGMLAAILIPAVSRSSEAAHRAECQTHLKQIGIAIKGFEEEHPNEAPHKMSDLYPKYISDINVFSCPSSTETNRAPDKLDGWSAYEFVAPPSAVDGPIVREKNPFHVPKGRNILYKDGHVEFVRDTGSEEWAPVENPGSTDAKPAAALAQSGDDPVSVARAFLTALAANELDKALQEVKPEQRHDFKDRISGNRPPIPDGFELKTESIVEGRSAQVQIVNSEFGLDLVFENGRWWITR